MGSWKIHCISSLAQPSFSSGLAGSKPARSLRFTAASLCRLALLASVAACRAAASRSLRAALLSLCVASLRSGVSVMHDDAAQNIICNQCWIHNHTQHTCATKDEPTHTPRRCHLCCLLPAPRSFSLSVSLSLLWCRLYSLSPLSFFLSVSRPLLWCRLCSLSPLSFSLSVSPQPVCVRVCDHSCAFCTLPCPSLSLIHI